MPWWAWVIAVVTALVGLALVAGTQYRNRVLREFTALLRERWPELKIVGRRRMVLFTVGPGEAGRGRMNLRNMYRAILDSNAANAPDQRQVIYEHWLKVFQDGSKFATSPVSPEQLEKLMPRLVPNDFFAKGRSLSEIPNVPLGETGLYAVCVLDSESSVVYVTTGHLADLGVTEGELMGRALQNLKAVTPAKDLVRGAFAKGSAMLVKTLDTYDAARLLLLPDALEEGQHLIAAVPDRDTLVFIKAPEDGDLSRLNGLLTPGSDKLLLNRLLKVTCEGIELA